MTEYNDYDIEKLDKRLTKSDNYIISEIHGLRRDLEAPTRICWVLSAINLGFLLFLCSRYWI